MKIKRNIHPTIIAVALLLLAACNNDEMAGTQGEGRPVQFVIGQPPAFTDAPGTRAGIKDIEEGEDKGKGIVEWENGDKLYVTMYIDDSDFQLSGILEYNGSEWTTDDELYWPAGYSSANFIILYGSQDEDLSPFYSSSHGDAPANQSLNISFDSSSAQGVQLVFRGIRPGQELTFGAGWQGMKLNAHNTGHVPYVVNNSLTGTGDDMVVYLYPNSSSDLTYSIDGVQAGDFSGIEGSLAQGQRYVIYCGGGGTSAGDIAERERFLAWYNGDMSTDFTLQRDITLTEPLESKSLPEGRVFDGDGHTIHGLEANAGLFSENHGLIVRLIVQGAEIESSDAPAGVIAGTNYHGAMVFGCQAIDCTVRATNDWAVGGIVGYNYNGRVGACLTRGGTVSGTNYAGGIVGWNHDEMDTMDTGVVFSCYAEPENVTGNGEYTGVLVGFNEYYSFIRGCYWYHNTQQNGVGKSNEEDIEAVQAYLGDLTSQQLELMENTIDNQMGTEWGNMVKWTVDGLVYL